MERKLIQFYISGEEYKKLLELRTDPFETVNEVIQKALKFYKRLRKK